jgi:hypothetical protein
MLNVELFGAAKIRVSTINLLITCELFLLVAVNAQKLYTHDL